MSLLKIIHLSAVVASFTLFFLRGIWLLSASPIMRQRWVKIAPHSVDTVLLVSAIALAWQLGFSPFNSPWLAAKIIALLVYIGLGLLAFRFARTRGLRLTAWLTALLTFAYIVATALSHDPLPGLQR
ncbi:MAG: SirB2 family protein [Gammaproteobacteria bacterium]|nr:SirB2 family protein [Gammaproteobacteria bacterium]MBU1625658.1 SirB2 family protein [Gammaproteobacteria bacterium]MBU1980918.1 SirB2 family protein [Gammaproteobacteria bacterium]